MKRFLLGLLLAVVLAGCQDETIIIPPWFAPAQQFTLECRALPDDKSECSLEQWGTDGDM